MEFKERINSIENGMLRLLEHGDSSINQTKMTGVRAFDVYSGQLEAETDEQLKKIISQLKEDFPLVLAGYTDGKDFEDKAKGRSPGIALDFRHDCSFVVFCLALLRVWIVARWPIARPIVLFIAALLPFGPFLIDRRMRGWEAEFDAAPAR